ncbi:4-hydroxy-2-oxovalerate aldolase [Oribacterium sp. C9]|uniref:4-hydroxy-2-oxovalerate aldolase n=1 Tax=Oribacterium sp. C9 TaxID=1943579 RepID=UPI00098F6E8B|nr:4-hydroxy-2-oxovalerate aldolase [Oribacterium sp. C9]OON85179.1 4-hydroxy-2-oxovalerate aldolase [Oribacterium sp. C9]
MSVTLMDCTLRDGANVVGKGFDKEITEMVLDGLTSCHVPIIEFGNAGGIGAYEVAGFTNALTDKEYLDIAQKYLNRGSEIGMFLNSTRYRENNIDIARENGMAFLRVGAAAGNGSIAVDPIKAIKKRGMKAFYSIMKAYLLTADELVEEAKMLEAAGLDEITIMDSAGTMIPSEVAEYTKKLKEALSIPVAFHCHNNLSLSAANAIAAYESGADILDCGLMGMARSAGNLATEACVGIMQRMGEMKDVDLYKMLHFIDKDLQPAMEKHNFHNPITPLDLVLGISGAHSSFNKTFKKVAEEQGVDLYKLIIEVSKQNRKNPSEDLMNEVAATLK